MKDILFGIACTSMFFGGYQLVARSAGKTDLTGTLIMALAALLPLGLAALWQGVAPPSLSTSVKLSFAGGLMGVGLAFNIWVITHPRIDVSTAVTAIAALVVAVATIGGIFLFQETFSSRKIAGIILAVMAIILLKPDGSKEHLSKTAPPAMNIQEDLPP